METTEIMLPETEALTAHLGGPSEEERARREEMLRSNPDQWDERTAVERLMDRIIRARMTYYRPHALPSLRRDIICLCCGTPYRPDDPLDAVNMFLCLTCKRDGEEAAEAEVFGYGTQQP